MIALVTGASRGIGAAAARQLASAGYDILVHYNKNKEAAEKIATETGGIPLQADLADFEQIDRMCREIHSPVDLLVNNAGVSVTGLFQDITDAEMMRVFGVNILGMMHLTKKLLPGMIRSQRGCIVNVASVWGETGASCEVHYSASKAAVIGFTKALAKEVGPSGIRVNCVSPGVICTDMNRIHSPETMQALAEKTPLQRNGSAEEVAAAICFLASEQAAFITGQVLPVNGGFEI